MLIRRVRADEGAVLRDVRLRMLADSPDAYLTTLAEAEAHPLEVFDDRARSQASGTDRATFMALDGDDAIGSVTGISDDDGGRQLVAMWVDPEHRRSGVGRALVESLLDWAWAGPADRVTLWVVDSNQPAKGLYQSFGFQPTGGRQPLPHRPELIEVEMELRRPGARPRSD